MFSENNRISERQAFRLLTYDLLGLSTLILPGVLARTAGRDGIFGIAIGTAAAILYLRMLCALQKDCALYFPAYLEQRLGRVWGKLVQAGFLLYLLLLAGYTAYLFADAVLMSLLREESFYLVLCLLLILVFYGLWGGLEGRARIYELLFWVLLIPLFLMLFFSLDEIRTDYWIPVFTAGAGSVAEGGYYVFSALAVIMLILFLGNRVKEKEGLFRLGKRAVLLTAGIHAALYLILLGVFGERALGSMEYPAVTLMSTVRISGLFLRRTDAFMFAVWFFTLYALLTSCIFYSGEIVLQLLAKKAGQTYGGKREKAAYVAAIFLTGATAVVCYRSLQWMERLVWLLCYVGTPFLVLVPFGLYLSRGWKQKILQRAQRGAAMIVLLLLCGGIFSGCKTAELEDRDFPVELALSDESDLTREFLDAGNAGNRMIDYSHLKVMILSRSFIENEGLMEELLRLLREKNEIPQSAYVVVADDAKGLQKAEEVLGEPVGVYLEQTFENVSPIKKQAYPTLGMLYQERENQNETLLLPFVKEEQEGLAVDCYYVWKRGAACGKVEKDAALLSFFTQGQMKEYQLPLKDGSAVSLTGAHTKISFGKEGEERQVTVKLRCSGELTGARQPEGEEDRRLTGQIEAYMNRLAKQTLSWHGVDVTNSFRKLGAERDGYLCARERTGTYETALTIRYEVVIDWINL